MVITMVITCIQCPSEHVFLNEEVVIESFSDTLFDSKEQARMDISTAPAHNGVIRPSFAKYFYWIFVIFSSSN